MEIYKYILDNFNPIHAIQFTALIWVLISIAKRFIHSSSIINKYLCVKCLCFWITLAITLNPFTASFSALLGALVDRYLNSTGTRL